MLSISTKLNWKKKYQFGHHSNKSKAHWTSPLVHRIEYTMKAYFDFSGLVHKTSPVLHQTTYAEKDSTWLRWPGAPVPLRQNDMFLKSWNDWHTRLVRCALDPSSSMASPCSNGYITWQLTLWGPIVHLTSLVSPDMVAFHWLHRQAGGPMAHQACAIEVYFFRGRRRFFLESHLLANWGLWSYKYPLNQPRLITRTVFSFPNTTTRHLSHSKRSKHHI